LGGLLQYKYESTEVKMPDSLKIGIIGDFDSRFSQQKTVKLLDHASKSLSISLNREWLPTKILNKSDNLDYLQKYHGFWCGPGDYMAPEGALRAIKFSRENNWPFFGT
jgi:CTP synthase (UTP-ammonia lyase)